MLSSQKMITADRPFKVEVRVGYKDFWTCICGVASLKFKKIKVSFNICDNLRYFINKSTIVSIEFKR